MLDKNEISRLIGDLYKPKPKGVSQAVFLKIESFTYLPR